MAGHLFRNWPGGQITFTAGQYFLTELSEIHPQNVAGTLILESSYGHCHLPCTQIFG